MLFGGCVSRVERLWKLPGSEGRDAYIHGMGRSSSQGTRTYVFTRAIFGNQPEPTVVGHGVVVGFLELPRGSSHRNVS